MAQTKNSRSGGGTAKKKQPTSTARTSGAKKNTASARNGSAKSAAARGASARNVAQAAPQKPMRRQVGSIVLLFVGIVAFIAWFPAQGWLVNAYRALIRGLFGWGYYIAPIALLGGAFILGFHRGRPVQARLICVLLLPMVFGAFVHMVACERDGLFALGSSYGFRQLWVLAQDPAEHCGGVISGLIGIALKKSISVVGGFIVLLLAFVLMTLRALDMTPAELWEKFKNRPRLAYEPEEPEEPGEDEFFSPEDYLFPVNGGTPIRKREKKKAPAAPAKQEQTPARRRMYDEDWEEHKDRIFAAMDIDPSASLRVAAAIEAEQVAAAAQRAEEKKKQEKPRSEKKPEPKPVETARTEPPAKPAPEMEKIEPLSMEDAAEIAGVELNSADMDGGAAAPASEKMKIDKDAEAELVADEIASAAAEEKPEYVFPELSLLNKSDPEAVGEEDGLDENEAQLEAAIRSFGVGATITGAIHGPSITRYELRLDQGVKLNKITNLAGDIALSLGVSSVRIAPIPDKISTVGVEVPNRKIQTVWLGDVIDSETFRSAKSKLSVAMGKDIGGNVIVGNIAKMPHVLIAGTTGSGKSVCINSLILSLLYKSTPDEVRMIMIDPKMVELGIYNGMPHLYVPVVTDPKKAAGALQWSVVEMLKRYRLFSEVGVRDLAGYNAVLRSNDQQPLPQVVIIIDELADLMMVAAKEVEESICRVAQMGRAAGMHLVVATQRPSADVITGLMKANIPSRVAFAVSSALDSRIILDQQGAEKLIGMGDMLYKPIGSSKPLRVQGAFVTDEEREEIINFVKREAEAEYSDEILAEIEKASVEKKGKGDESEEETPKNDYDELLPQAVDVIFETKQASVSMLQRRLKLGYSRAARLIDQLEEVGVVGPYEGSKPRQIMITKQQWQEMQYAQGTAPVDTIAQEFAAVAENDTFASPEDDEGQDAPFSEVGEPDDEGALLGEDGDL